MLSAFLLVVIFGPMLVEARRAASNERAQRARGGLEPPGDVYRWMRVAYPVGFLAMIVEGAVRGGAPPKAFTAGVLVFLAAKALKWWAIAALGSFWTFRVVVVPGMTLVTGGPYRYVTHPNYFAVLGELAGAALMCGAWIAGPAVTVAFGLLIVRRIAVENRALRSAGATRVEVDRVATDRPEDHRYNGPL
jgi:methyltransferase